MSTTRPPARVRHHVGDDGDALVLRTSPRRGSGAVAPSAALACTRRRSLWICRRGRRRTRRKGRIRSSPESLDSVDSSASLPALRTPALHRSRPHRSWGAVPLWRPRDLPPSCCRSARPGSDVADPCTTTVVVLVTGRAWAGPRPVDDTPWPVADSRRMIPPARWFAGHDRRVAWTCRTVLTRHTSRSCHIGAMMCVRPHPLSILSISERVMDCTPASADRAAVAPPLARRTGPGIAVPGHQQRERTDLVEVDVGWYASRLCRDRALRCFTR